ncbi:hypothetical protein GL263_09290 [Streptomyces durbertensis]|uniref:Serine/threonine protein kinase n=1 Tax=Streptomyces durbertensis TaxID=2448886 RepID=A0ABR6EFK7_9ACTN|nr:hypothetical protein [Streptomyces durbertensis]MBB1243750.1 hypothetical protein [Streptomyces durbertensis]
MSHRWEEDEPEHDVLRGELRRAADAVPVGPAPTAAVVRAGRARRRRQRTVAGAAVAAVLAAPLAVLSWPHPADERPSPPAVVSPSPEDPEPVEDFEPRPAPPRTVKPDEPVRLAAGVRLCLSEEGRQKYAVLEKTETAAGARCPSGPATGTGDNIRERSLSSGYTSTTAEGVLRLYGVWRHDEVPSRVEVRAGGRSYSAELFTLPGRPGWGVYFLDARALPRFTSYRVVGYDATGRPFATLRASLGVPGPQEPGKG